MPCGKSARSACGIAGRQPTCMASRAVPVISSERKRQELIKIAQLLKIYLDIANLAPKYCFQNGWLIGPNGLRSGLTIREPGTT